MIKEFLDIFFWVYLVGIVLMTIVHWTKEEKERRKNAIKYGTNPNKIGFGIITLVLFILSIKYKFFI